MNFNQFISFIFGTALVIWIFSHLFLGIKRIFPQ